MCKFANLGKVNYNTRVDLYQNSNHEKASKFNSLKSNREKMNHELSYWPNFSHIIVMIKDPNE